MPASFQSRPSATLIAQNAWASVRDAATAMKPLFASACVLSVILSGATFSHPILAWLARPAAGAPLSADVRYLAARSALALAWVLLQTPVAVAMHRFILLGEVTPGVISYAPHHTRLFFLWLLAVRIFLLVAGALIFLPQVYGFVTFFVAVGIIGGLIISIYLAMIFPAVATDVPSQSWSERIEKSMEQISGSFWLLWWASVMAFLPVSILAIVLEAAFFRHWIADAIRSGTQGPLLFAGAYYGCMEILNVALAAALASWLYAWVRDNKPG